MRKKGEEEMRMCTVKSLIPHNSSSLFSNLYSLCSILFALFSILFSLFSLLLVVSPSYLLEKNAHRMRD